jgi:hypothetical protein
MASHEGCMSSDARLVPDMYAIQNLSLLFYIIAVILFLS